MVASDCHHSGRLFWIVDTWSDNTVVDFEVGINRCIRRIRSVLLDDADAPRYLETIPRIGYRFIAPLKRRASNPSRAKNLLSWRRRNPRGRLLR